MEKEVLSAIIGNNEAVTFGSAEEFDLAFHLWVADGYVTPAGIQYNHNTHYLSPRSPISKKKKNI